MSESERPYTNGEITVAWKPGICIHSAKCMQGLGEVFNLNSHPWINMDGAGTERIVSQVDQCPSGALSYFRNEKSAKSAG